MYASRVLSAVAVAAAALSNQAAFAQDKPTGTSMAPAGQGPNVSASSAATSSMSGKSRQGVKADTKAAEKSGALQPAGQAPQSADTDTKTGDKAMPSGSSKSRSSAMSEPGPATKPGSAKPAGQATEPAAETPKK